MDGGDFGSLGLKSDGSIVAWGDNTVSELNIPSPNERFISVAAGAAHNVAIRTAPAPASASSIWLAY
jgi:alpha-tubulin suppressor-like RCC1 family protein